MESTLICAIRLEILFSISAVSILSLLLFLNCIRFGIKTDATGPTLTIFFDTHLLYFLYFSLFQKVFVWWFSLEYWWLQLLCTSWTKQFISFSFISKVFNFGILLLVKIQLFNISTSFFNKLSYVALCGNRSLRSLFLLCNLSAEALILKQRLDLLNCKSIPFWLQFDTAAI